MFFLFTIDMICSKSLMKKYENHERRISKQKSNSLISKTSIIYFICYSNSSEKKNAFANDSIKSTSLRSA